MLSILNYIALFFAILMTVGSQLLLKIGSSKPSNSLNVTTLAGLLMLGVVTVLMVFALQEILLKVAVALNALSFAVMPLAAKIFLGEKITTKLYVGVAIIIMGIAIFLSGGEYLGS